MHATLKTIAAGTMGLCLAGPADAQDVTLNVTATPSIFKPMFEGLVEAFEADNPDIVIELDASQRDQSDMVQALLRQAIIGDLPDVSFQGYNYLRILVDQGLAVPLGPLLAADPEWTGEAYSPSVTASGTVAGEVFGLGVGMSFPILFYNADLVAAAQDGSAELPADWDGIFALAERIQSANDGVLGAFVRYNPFVYQGLVGSYGGSMMNADETAIAFTETPGQQTLDLLRRFGEAGQATTNMTREQARQAFISGSIAILVDSSSSLESFEQQTAGTFSVGTARLPLISETPHLPTAGVAVVMLTEDPERQAASWRFMRFVASAEGQGIVGRLTGYVPANAVAVERADILGDYYADRPNMQAALTSIPIAGAWYAFPGENAVRIDRAIEDRLDQVVTLRQTPEEAMADLEAEVLALLPR